MSNENAELVALWDDFMAEGLLPVGRVHITIKDTNVKDKKNDKGEAYKSMGVQYEIDVHEEIDRETFKPETGWMNFYLRGKTVQRLRDLYKGCTGRAIQPTGRDQETGKPFVNYSLILDELKGLGCWSAYIWRKDKETGELRGDLGWNFAQQIEAISKPQNPHLKNDEEEEEIEV